MMYLRSTNATEANKELGVHIFGNADRGDLNLTSDWSMEDNTGEHYMKRKGYSVLGESIDAYLKGKFTTHRYLHSRVRNESDGIATMSAMDCSTLRAIKDAKSDNTKHVMVLRAVRNRVLTPEVIQFACGAKRAVRPFEAHRVDPNANKDKSGVEVMLVTKDDDEPVRGRKKRRKKSPEESST